MLTPTQRDDIIDAAIQAPSADNRPPWLYNWSAETDQLNLFRNPTLTGDATDKSYVLSNLTIAAAIENAVLKAAQLNFCTHVSYFGDEPGQIASLVFKADANNELDDSDKSLAAQIFHRHTNRMFPYTGNIDESQQQALEASITDPNCQLTLVTDKPRFKRMTKIIKRAEAVRFRHEDLHQELFSAMIFDDKSPSQGMTLPMLGIDEKDTWFFRFVKKWSNMRKLNFIGGSHIIAKRSVDVPFKNAPAVCVICTQDNSELGVLAAGRQLQRFWLKATELGISVHPYAAPGVLTLAQADLSAEVQADLAPVKPMLDQELGNQNHAVMFYRIGFSESCSTKSLRPARTSLQK